MRFTFPKSEKLKSRKRIQYVFSEGTAVKKYPVKLVFAYPEKIDGVTIQATFVVPKRLFKSAVKRNKIKRQMRETYRLHKHEITGDSDRTAALVFIYYAHETLSYDRIERAIEHIIQQFNATQFSGKS